MTERKSLVSERDELMAAIEAPTSWRAANVVRFERIKEIDTELRRLAAQDQKPVAFLHETEWGDKSLSFEPAKNHLQWKDTPLYIAPPTAAGWDDAIEAALVVLANMPMKDESHTSTLLDARKAIVALRHNAPPDSGAGTAISELEPNETTIAALREADAAEPEARFNNVEDMMDWLDAPDHGGADAGVRLTPEQISIINDMICAWVDREKKGEFREAFRSDCKRLLKTALSKPAPVAANASADDYRNAIDEALVTRFIGVAKGDAKAELNQIIEWDVAVALDPKVSSAAQDLIDRGRNASAEARLRGESLSAHPHASDCDKQGER